MRKEEILKILKEEKPKLAAEFGVEELALFGSYARGEETDASDVDILVKLKPDYFKLMKVLRYLETKLHKNIELTRKGPHLSERFLKSIGQDLIYV